MRTDKQPKLAEMAQEVPAREAWRVFGIMAEFVEATERLVGIHPAVSVFGSARVKPGTEYWKLAEDTARLLSAIVESSEDAIVSKSLDGTIQTWNAGAERLFGYRSEDALGRHISLIIPHDRLAEEGVEFDACGVIDLARYEWDYGA